MVKLANEYPRDSHIPLKVLIFKHLDDPNIPESNIYVAFVTFSHIWRDNYPKI